jgi:hypothetical protein
MRCTGPPFNSRTLLKMMHCTDSTLDAIAGG